MGFIVLFHKNEAFVFNQSKKKKMATKLALIIAIVIVAQLALCSASNPWYLNPCKAADSLGAMDDRICDSLCFISYYRNGRYTDADTQKKCAGASECGPGEVRCTCYWSDDSCLKP